MASDVSGSSRASRRGSASMIVTSAPRRRKAWASSQPMAPPPEHGQRRRQPVELEDRLIGQVVEVGEPLDRGDGRNGAGGEHDAPGAEHRPVDVDLAGTPESGPAVEDLDALAPEHPVVFPGGDRGDRRPDGLLRLAE